MSGIELIVRAVIAAVVIGVLIAVVKTVDHAISEHYVAPVRVELEKRIKAESDRADASEATNASLRASIGGAQEKVKECNDRVDWILSEQNAIEQDSEKEKKEIQARYQQTIADLVKKASTPTIGAYLEQARKADATLSALATRQRVRDAARAAAAGR
jgi:hypothetical protein